MTNSHAWRWGVVLVRVQLRPRFNSYAPSPILTRLKMIGCEDTRLLTSQTSRRASQLAWEILLLAQTGSMRPFGRGVDWVKLDGVPGNLEALLGNCPRGRQKQARIWTTNTRV